MATDFFQRRPEDEEENGEVAQSTGQESPVVAGDPGERQEGQGTRSGSFTNLQSYLDANESKKFGQEVAGRVGMSADEALRAQDETDKTFRSKVDSSAVGYNEGLINRVKSDPTGVVKDEPAKSEFVKMRDARYQGPRNLSDENDLYTNVYNQTQGAAKAADASKNANDRKALLDQYYGTGAKRYDYSSGQKKLDNYLIQVDPGSREAFQGVQEKAKTAQDRFGLLTNALNSYAGQKSQETAQTRAQSRGAVGIDDAGNVLDSSPIKQTYAQAQARAQELDRQRQAELETNRSQLGSYTLDSGVMGKVGLQDGLQTWGVDPTNYFNSVQTPDVASVASRDEQARVAALAELAGTDNVYLPDASRAGTYDPNQANRFELDRYLSDVNTARARIEPAIAARDKAARNDLLARQWADQIRSQGEEGLWFESPESRIGKADIDRFAEQTGARYTGGGILQWLDEYLRSQQAAQTAARASIPSNYEQRIKGR